MVSAAKTKEAPSSCGWAAAASAIASSVPCCTSVGEPAASEGLAGHGQRVLPGRRPGVAGVGDHGGELGELRVLRLGDAGVGGQDEVGLERGDLLDGRAVGVAVAGGLLAVEVGQCVVEPGGRLLGVAAPGDGDGPHGHHAQGEGVVLVGPAERDDPGRLGLDRGLAEGVLDGDGEGPAVGVGGRLGGGRGGAGRAAGAATGEGAGADEGEGDGRGTEAGAARDGGKHGSSSS